MSLGRMGAKGFDPAKEIAKEYPHKWNSGTLYRDFLRVIQRKYPEPQKTKYTNLLRASFREHGFIDDEERMKLMGTGPTTLGSVAIEEEFYEKGIKHPEHPSRYDLVDTFASNLDCQRIHPLPYLIQRDMWYYFGLGEQQQDIIATKISRMAKKLSDKYTERSYEEREECRQWIVNRLALFEESFANSNTMTSMSMETANKIKEIFAYLDEDNDGYISYKNMFYLLNNQEYESESTEIKDLLYNRDSIKLSTEAWYYMSDILYPLENYLAEYPENKQKEKDLTAKYLQCSHLNPLYRKKGWSLEQLTDAYVKYNFFDVDHHYALIQNTTPPKEERIYNLWTEVAMNIPSISLIVEHAFATGQHLYVHILTAEEDPDAVTWEKLEEIHEKMGTMDVINKAREKEEILPQDVLYYDPELCTQEIPATIPDYSVFWHSVFENQMQDLPDYVIQDYFDTIVKPDIEANNEGMFVEPKNNIERDRMIEEHVYNEMERYMQSWCWKRYAQLLTNPVYAISTWDEHKLTMNIFTMAAPPNAPTVITINDHSPEEQIQLAFTKKIRHYSLCSFFGLILFNFTFYVIFFSISGMAFIFPVNDILSSYYDTGDVYVVVIFSINCAILIFCILSEVKLTEMRITTKSYINWLTFYIMLNLFYIFLTPILLLPIVKLLSISNCYSFKTKINKFIKPQIENTEEAYHNNDDQDESASCSTDGGENTKLTATLTQDENKNINCTEIENENEKHFRLIAAHHWFSKLCYKLKVESLRAHNKEANNRTLYQLLSECLDNKLCDIMDRNERLNEEELSLNNLRYSPKEIYRVNVVKTGKGYDMKRKVFLRLYLLAINVSMIRLVFFNDNFNLKRDYFGLYVVFWIRITIEIVLVIMLIVLMKTHSKIKEIAKNHIGTQYYFAVLLSAEYKAITKIIFDNLEQECSRFYAYWHYELHGIDTKILLIKWIGHDIGCIVFQYLFDDNIYNELNNDKKALDIDPEVWKQIKNTAFPNNP